MHRGREGGREGEGEVRGRGKRGTEGGEKLRSFTIRIKSSRPVHVHDENTARRQQTKQHNTTQHNNTRDNSFFPKKNELPQVRFELTCTCTCIYLPAYLWIFPGEDVLCKR